MSDFIFLPAEGTRLEHNSRGYFLISRSPLRALRINQSLYSLLGKFAENDYRSGIQQQDAPGKSRLLHLFLTLTHKGYFRLQKAADIETFPAVSIIIPTREVSRALIECLESVDRLDYPAEKLEILVVKDGNSAGEPDFPGIKIIKLEKSAGPASARNAGAATAGGELLAFLDADCIADKNWLKELVPFFQDEEIGAVGGFVDGYFKQSSLDRYEERNSSLNLGSRVLFEGNTESTFYVPTCNMLVRRKVFTESGGFRDGMRLGEDVDFCWRMRGRGYSLLYTPCGKVAHKHRNRLDRFMLRRGAYGTSEAVLYHSHRDKKKRLLIPLWAALSFLALLVAILLPGPYPLVAIPLFLGVDLWLKSRALKPVNSSFPFKTVLVSALRNHFSFYYFTCFHLVRYYLILLVGLGFLYHPLWYFCGFALLLTSVVDYSIKKPQLIYPLFLFFYLLEHVAYQAGVFWGCLKKGYFGSYLPVFTLAWR